MAKEISSMEAMAMNVIRVASNRSSMVEAKDMVVVAHRDHMARVDLAMARVGLDMARVGLAMARVDLDLATLRREELAMDRASLKAEASTTSGEDLPVRVRRVFPVLRNMAVVIDGTARQTMGTCMVRAGADPIKVVVINLVKEEEATAKTARAHTVSKARSSAEVTRMVSAETRAVVMVDPHRPSRTVTETVIRRPKVLTVVRVTTDAMRKATLTSLARATGIRTSEALTSVAMKAIARELRE